nr:immunoglobulin heavy chain junction region [Macaca mulatta]MOY23968.1 immunoglobulin heavy chain junction region [Macaca mulatta]MOY27552.1 immunoglobulin heavy chain junction region [Macaca mulatta]MOY29750.1 immunoglobulin heavy chain junction region [Macaca mulatta]
CAKVAYGRSLFW